MGHYYIWIRYQNYFKCNGYIGFDIEGKFVHIRDPAKEKDKRASQVLSFEPFRLLKQWIRNIKQKGV